jgi:hypothetical protein
MKYSYRLDLEARISYDNIPVLFKNVFDKDHPYYSPNNVSVQTKGRSLNYDQTIDLIHDQFTKHPELAAGNYPLYFHGSSSASLPGFVQDKGLVSLGHLLEQGRAPLTGEIVFGGTEFSTKTTAKVFFFGCLGTRYCPL